MEIGNEETAARAWGGLQQLDRPRRDHFASPPPYVGPNPEILRRRLGVDIDDIERVEWAGGGRPGYGNGPVEVWSRDGRTRIIDLDIREPDDFHVYMLCKDRFGLDRD